MLAERNGLAIAVRRDMADGKDWHVAAEWFSHLRQDRCHPAVQREFCSRYDGLACVKPDRFRSRPARRSGHAGPITLRGAQRRVVQKRRDQACKA